MADADGYGVKFGWLSLIEGYITKVIIRFLGPEMCVISNVNPSKQGEDTVLFILHKLEEEMFQMVWFHNQTLLSCMYINI